MREGYVDASALADSWGVSRRRIQMMCANGEIPEAEKSGRIWIVPANTEKPADKRVVTGKYKKKRIVPDRTDGYRRMLDLLCREIRSDLDAVIGYSQMMKESGSFSEQNLEHILSAGDNSLAAIRNISVWMEAKREPEEKQDDFVPVRSVLEMVASGFRTLCGEKEIALTTIFSVNHLFIRANRRRYEQILKNLLSCSLKEAKSGSTITFRVDVISDGPEESVLRYVIQGTGGGLTRNSLSYEVTELLVEHMGGVVDVDYVPRLGTTITMELKHLKVAEETGADEEKTDQISLAGKRILLIEDNQFSMELTRAILENEGMIVDAAEDGIIGVAKVRLSEKGYDCILTDLMMPNMDGITAARMIRGLTDWERASIPIIAMTSSVSEETRREVMEAGMIGLIEKPVDRQKLIRLLKKAKPDGMSDTVI